MVEIVVYLDPEYKTNETIEVPANSTRDEILAILNSRFKIWYYYDFNHSTTKTDCTSKR